MGEGVEVGWIITVAVWEQKESASEIWHVTGQRREHGKLWLDQDNKWTELNRQKKAEERLLYSNAHRREVGRRSR